MGLLKFLQLYACILVMVVAVLNSAESTVVIRFRSAPPPQSRLPTAIFRYSVERLDGSNACKNNACSIYCEIDGQFLRPCLADNLVLKNLTVNREHKFLLNVTTRDGETNSSAYSWFIDTIPPTATIHSEQNYTNAEKIYIDVTFSEACTGQGGFKCVNSSNCDVIINGPAQVHAPSLRIMEHGIKYRLNIIFSLRSMYGRIVITMADNFCTDQAGNHFTRSNGSTIIIHFDRRPVLVDLWTSVPSYELVINGVPRTVLATNKMEDIAIFLDFSIPIINSTEQILNALHVNSGSLIPIHGKIHGNRRFVFELKKISRTEIISVELQAGSIIGRTGTPVSSVASITFLYDSTDPGVVLSTSSPNITKESNINVIVEFMKPVFGFEASMVKVIGGTITRFKELSRALYSLTVLAEAQNMLSVNIPAGKVNDIAGNPNLASNQLEVKKYSTPPISIALHSFVTAGTVATALAAAIISLSTANLGAIGAVGSGSTTIFSPDPSMNLHGMIGHLQVFVLSDWLLVNQSIEYSETMKGLQWLIPHQKLPWNRNSPSIWLNHVNLAGKKLARNLSVLATGWSSHKITNQKIDLNLTNSFYMHHEQPFPIEIDPMSVWLHGQHNISMKDTPYGLPLNSSEYFTYFLRGEPISASNIVKRMKNYKGWQDMEMNLFWLGVGGGSLLTIHVLKLIFLRWRTGIPGHGILSVPRFELFLLILMLPCISQSSAFIIRGGTTRGIIIGALLLAIPAAFILSVCLFLVFAIFSGSFFQYKEVKHRDIEEPWCTKLWFFFTGRPTTGRWFYREGLSSSFLLHLGILFESWKGPPLFVFVNQNDPNTILRWTESGNRGIGRMRAISSGDSNEETKSSLSERLLGCAKSSYIILDLLRRVSLGIISGAYLSRKSSQSLFALTITLVQFMYLFTLKPYISRGVQVVESVSLLCEVGIFGLCVSIKSSNPVEAKKLGFVTLSLLFFTFVVQIINEWYGMIKSILRLSQPHKNSFKLGLKFVAKGLVLPFLPRQHWSKVIAATSQPTTGLTPVIPISPETEFERRDTRTPSVHSVTSMTAMVVPVLSPGLSSPNVMQMEGPTTSETTITGQRSGERKKLKEIKYESKSEMKKLRELAKASFSGDYRGGEASTSYAKAAIQHR
ncbi:uncharacterized protein LOC115976435 isoform X2 [Quercus lobata]|uniref:uncharacterized protein LOC115976435 isoform X2 n=1 Tax=Quercus lobata TaxID=97700 RepID=UPI001248E81B|nr:uncharacterized protein LOC115976435 isoform X2 [Quercus lobata]